ncbi:MAG: hypothetical protein EON51_17305 [Acinetobacter sp.]|nr:MAG: hypothetical protein EON51_17305 [Acinetobacter sp.]
MSLTTGLFAIKGQHLDKLSDVFAAFKLVDSGNEKSLTTWAAVEKLFNDEQQNPQDDIQHRVVWADNGWTIIEDVSFILCGDEAALEKLSQQLNAPIFALMTQGTSNCYAFWYYDKTKQRSFFNDNGNVADNFGTPLPQEIRFNINGEAFYDDVHGLAKELGIDWAKAEQLDKFIVKELTNSEELNKELEQFAQQHRRQQQESRSTDKPWWKIW